MNYKLEKFWNKILIKIVLMFTIMNYKLEKFWNIHYSIFSPPFARWTINLKSFEITEKEAQKVIDSKMNYKLEKFWNCSLPL